MQGIWYRRFSNYATKLETHKMHAKPSLYGGINDVNDFSQTAVVQLDVRKTRTVTADSNVLSLNPKTLDPESSNPVTHRLTPP